MRRTYYAKNDYDGAPTYRFLSDLKPGDHVLVYSKQWENSATISYHLSRRLADTGMPGNTNPEIFRFHGWRGTSFGLSTSAHGVYAVKSVMSFKTADYDGSEIEAVKVVIGTKDLAKGME